jgi:hypothetical protein
VWLYTLDYPADTIDDTHIHLEPGSTMSDPFANRMNADGEVNYSHRFELHLRMGEMAEKYGVPQLLLSSTRRMVIAWSEDDESNLPDPKEARDEDDGSEWKFSKHDECCLRKFYDSGLISMDMRNMLVLWCKYSLRYLPGEVRGLLDQMQEIPELTFDIATSEVGIAKCSECGQDIDVLFTRCVCNRVKCFKDECLKKTEAQNWCGLCYTLGSRHISGLTRNNLSTHVCIRGSLVDVQIAPVCHPYKS